MIRPWQSRNPQKVYSPENLMTRNAKQTKASGTTVVHETTIVKNRKPNKNRSGSRKRNNGVTVRTTTTARPKSRPDPRIQHTKIALRPRRDVGPARKIASIQATGLATSIMLPYDGPLVRQRKLLDDLAVYTAITRNFVYHTLDYGRIMRTEGTAVLPKCGILPNLQPVWADLSQQVQVVNILDYRLLGIVPARHALNYPTDSSIIYKATEFLNNTQAGKGSFYVRKEQNFLGNNTSTPTKTRYFNDGNQVMWFDPKDFFPVGNTDAEGSYGPIHPALDAIDGRYVWIDGCEELGREQDLAECTQLGCQFTIPNGWFPIPDPIEMPNDSLLKLHVQRLSDDSNDDGSEITFESYFPLAPVDNILQTLVTIPYSGYYKVGISGGFEHAEATAVELVLTNLSIFFTVGSRINVVSRHIINPNVVLSDYKTPTFMTREQTNSGSLLIKNTTPELLRGGGVWAVSPTDDSNWFQFSSDTQRIQSYGGSPNRTFYGDFKTGAFGWLRSSAGATFREATESVDYTGGSYFHGEGTGAVALRSYSIQKNGNELNCRQRGMNVYLIVPPGQNDNVAPASINMNCQLLFTVQYEYSTASQVPVQQNQTYSQTLNEEVLCMLAEAPTFTENPLHISALGGMAKQLGASIGRFYSNNRTVAKGIFSALSAFGGPVASVLGKGALALDSFSESMQSYF